MKTTQATIPVGGHTSVKMSTKRKSPGRTVINPSNTSQSSNVELEVLSGLQANKDLKLKPEID